MSEKHLEPKTAEDPAETKSEELLSRIRPVSELAQTLKQVHSRYMQTLIGSYVIGALLAVGVTFLSDVRDWILFAGMELIIFAYLILYIKAHLKGRRILRFLSLVMVTGLLTFWIFVLIDRIPARPVYIENAVIQREELPALWGSVVLFGLVGAGLLVHWFYVGGLLERARSLLTPKNSN